VPIELRAPDTHDRLLAATETCLRRSGIRRTTVIEIAEEAGLSRATLYKHFPDKAALVVAALARTDEQFWAEATAQVSARTGLAAQVAEAVRIARERPPGALLLQLREAEPDAFTATVGTGLREMVPNMSLFWQPFLLAARDAGELRVDLDLARASEWVVRVVLSLVTIPGDRFDSDDPHSVQDFLADFLVAGLR
jgi:AcrR family transcriptional regulator